MTRGPPVLPLHGPVAAPPLPVVPAPWGPTPPLRPGRGAGQRGRAALLPDDDRGPQGDGRAALEANAGALRATRSPGSRRPAGRPRGEDGTGSKDYGAPDIQGRRRGRPPTRRKRRHRVSANEPPVAVVLQKRHRVAAAVEQADASGQRVARTGGAARRPHRRAAHVPAAWIQGGAQEYTTYTPGSGTSQSNDTSLKTIVLDGSWYDFLEGQALFLRDRCPVDRCRVYRGRAPEGATVDAFIFKDGYSSYYQAIREDERNQTVRILYLLENPQHTPIEKGATGIDWTATYRKDSDIVTPYEKFVLFDPLVKTIRRDHDYTQNKSKVAAWFVSNCYASNRRLEYARKLQEHIQVDIYGTCGPLECPRHTSEKCYQMVERDYYFYLAFENANCKDYITEKFFNALRHNVVPVVMGASREEYRAAAPHHSYVHVEDFRSPKELAEYLLLLSRNRTLYNEYFQWKGTGEFVNTYFWCRLCALLHAPPRPHQRRSEDVYRWWHTGACRAVNESL
ncbi:glycoprotein 3-alpha-L-fucosyltransferase A-like isoform X3 [Amblyomma americanum]